MKWDLEVGVVRSYWWKNVSNFGDALSPLLFEHFTGIKTEWTEVNKAHVVSIGSILEHIPRDWNGYIVGSGKLEEFSKIDISRATVLSLRGPLSARGVYGNFT